MAFDGNTYWQAFTETSENGGSDMLSLRKDEESLFIDLWERAECLWNPRDIDYKNRHARRAALRNIAIGMKHPEWTNEQIRRKLDSFRAQWRAAKRKKEASEKTESSGSSSKTWQFFGRIQSFLGTTLYGKPKVVNNVTSSKLTSPVEADISLSDEDSSYSGESTDTTDTDDMIQPVHKVPTVKKDLQSRPRPVSPSPSVPMVAGSTSPPPSKKRVLDSGKKPRHRTSDQFEECALTVLRLMYESRQRKTENPLETFGKTVAQRLGEIKSRKRLAVVKNTIDQVIHTAIMEEMPDD